MRAHVHAHYVHPQELEFNGQLIRQTVVRPQDASSADVVAECCAATGASLVVVPSIRLCGAAHNVSSADTT